MQKRKMRERERVEQSNAYGRKRVPEPPFGRKRRSIRKRKSDQQETNSEQKRKRKTQRREAAEKSNAFSAKLAQRPFSDTV
jgi:hypothetical protein